MGSCGEEEECFFDSREDAASSISDSGSDCAENSELNGRTVDWISGNFHYEIWSEKPASINERRHRFLRLMGLDQYRDSPPNQPGEISGSPEIERVTENSGAVLRSSDSESRFSSSRSSISSWFDETPELLEDRGSGEGHSPDGGLGNLFCRIKNLDDGTEFVIDELGQDGMLSRLREVGSNRVVGIEEFHQRTLGLSPFVQRFMQREEGETSNLEESTKRKSNWLRRLRAAVSIVKRQGDGKIKSSDSDPAARVARCLKRVPEGPHRVKVRHYRKNSKEFSALYMAQEIQAHKGSILSMKFSLDGQYLASAGEDGVVRVWQIIESERNDMGDLDADSSCMYLTINDSELAPLFNNKEKLGKIRNTRKSFDSACIIIPPKVFRISEKPIHEFHGHTGHVLDLSWSKNKYLLSSSMDKTVRLWQVGCGECLKVFSHNNYVTCIQFNPVDDNYFISGSIDGKVRIWAIRGCQVVDWIDIREIVTAVCYNRDGQGAIVGSMDGNCRFYDASGNHLQLDAQICLQGKKKSPSKRITGFQFAPNDRRKVMVTSADSQVRIINGVDIICKYRGLRNSGSQISASFTSDGKHIISASEDSHVYVWNYCSSPDGPASNRVKSVWSCERFFSSNASVAIPWSGLRSGDMALGLPETVSSHQHISSNSSGSLFENGKRDHWESPHSMSLSFSSPDCFSPSQGFFSELLPRGSATWPEEKLPASSSLSVSSSLCKSQYKFLKNACQNSINSAHSWGLVIVTAGWDGRIRTFHNYGLPVRP